MTRTERGGVWDWLPRTLLGLVLIATGTGKALDMPGFVRVIAAYQLMPEMGNVWVAYSLPAYELLTGLALFAGVRLREAAWAAVLLHIVMLAVTLATLLRGIHLDNCGCFGVYFARPLTWGTPVEDAVLLVLSVLILWRSLRTSSPCRA